MPNIWPAAFPQDMLFESYSETLPDGAIRTQMDAGPAKLRKRSDAGYRIVEGEVILTTTQLTDLVDFYEDTLSQGTALFEWKNQISQTTQEFRFTAPPKWRTWAPGRYAVALALEQKTT